MKEIGSLVLGAFIGLTGVFYFIQYPESWSIRSGLLIVLCIVVSLPLSILLHEFGHFLAGRLQGMRLLNLSVGPFVIERHEGKLHFHFTPSFLNYLGRAMMTFPEHMNKEDMRKKLIRYLFGGPMINIIGSFLLVGIAFGIWHHPFFLFFGIINVLLGFTNLKPVMAENALADGFAIKKLRTVPVEDSVIISAYSVLVEGTKTFDMKQWDASLIEQLEGLIATDDPIAKSFFPTLGYYYLPEDPEKVLAIGRTSAFTREAASSDYYSDCADITFATALFFNDELKDYPSIEEELRKIGKSDIIIDLKRSALLSYIEGDFKGAIEHLKIANDSLKKWHPIYLRGEMERELLTAMIDKII
ncbi:M50 family metallopeptidase [Sporosarcina sp. ACRSL]|uniref:M50 family metallopeptidase n=1 Tax=Sporosarcina sp. ACRSL TaxID=2918215 RepID=UPI001EF654E6|nr:M50 family metallopeptidase [Sporosarcina sp. ACRSL]MCG7343611.1 M50 family metallopeptidase [Sporosarcina sp. ACRSL]